MSYVKQAVTHITGPLLWTIAIYAMSTTCSTKMAKEFPQQQHLQLGLCLFPHFAAYYLKLTATILLSFLSHSVLFYYLVFSHCLWIVLTSSSYPWSRVQGKDTVNGSFHAFSESFLCS